MGRKIFVTYKYADGQVERLPEHGIETTVRHYVDELQSKLEDGDHINKGEEDGTDLSAFSDEKIASVLRDKIYDSTVTLIMVSPGMNNPEKEERDQWMPWEISYSLRHKTRNDRQSAPNALLGIVLPDREGSYQYFFEEKNCPNCTSVTLRTDRTFPIIQKNAFNAKKPEAGSCDNHSGGKTYRGNHSYIRFVRWSAFEGAIDTHLEQALAIQALIDDYTISSTI